MTDWRELARRARQEVRAAVVAAGDAAGIHHGYEVVPYRGWGTAARLLVHGRVVGRERLSAADAGQSAWRNLVDAVKRLDSRPLPHARLRATLGAITHEVVADDEGFFSAWLDAAAPLAPGAWHTVTLALADPPQPAPVQATARALVPAATARFAIVSDVDDTVVETGATAPLRALRSVLLENARTRPPVEGAADFLGALAAGASPAPAPLFYVSASPWNLHDALTDFLAAHGFPEGPLVLRDWDLAHGALSSAAQRDDKRRVIDRLMDTWPALPFVLVGDSGQHDAELYAEVARDRPGRVRAVYIRDVQSDAARGREIAALAETVRAQGSELLLTAEYREATAHARARGWAA